MKADDEIPLRLRRVLIGGKDAKGWTLQQVANRAQFCIRKAHETIDGTSDEVAVWGSIQITKTHVQAFEDYHRSPLGSIEKRARLLGITLALDLDPAEVNRAAGGI